jgi:hypothetical protein
VIFTFLESLLELWGEAGAFEPRGVPGSEPSEDLRSSSFMEGGFGLFLGERARVMGGSLVEGRGDVMSMASLGFDASGFGSMDEAGLAAPPHSSSSSNPSKPPLAEVEVQSGFALKDSPVASHASSEGKKGALAAFSVVTD